MHIGALETRNRIDMPPMREQGPTAFTLQQIEDAPDPDSGTYRCHNA